MDGELIRRFIGKKIVFKKREQDIVFVGALLEVTNNSIVIDFKGHIQLHSISDITQLELGFEDEEGSKNG
jgi:ferredoxin-fold anticodon binding domain-containing protein